MIKNVVIFLIKAYQAVISPILGKRCRFYPSCSEYGIWSIRKNGLAGGCLKTARRLLRCHPWNPGGIDMP